jgi:hypothetical protein
MPATAVQAQRTQFSPAQFWSAIKQWLKQNSTAAMQSAIIGALFGYGLNFVMSLSLFSGGFDGSQGALGSLFKSSLFFGVLSTVVFGLIGYRRAVGKERFWQAIRNAPKTVAMLFRQDGAAARVHLLWGAAISLLAMQFVSPWLGAAVAVGFLAAIPSIFGRVLSALLFRLWSSLVQLFAPTKGQRVEGSVSMLVGMVGASAALILGGLLSDPSTKLALAAGCIVAAFMMRKSGPTSALPLILIGLATLVGQILGDLLYPLLALAQERPIPGEMGGLLTGGGDGETPGISLLGVTWNSTAGLVGAGIGAPLGFGIGSVVGQYGDDWYNPGGGDWYGSGSGWSNPWSGWSSFETPPPYTPPAPPPQPPVIQPPVVAPATAAPAPVTSGPDLADDLPPPAMSDWAPASPTAALDAATDLPDVTPDEPAVTSSGNGGEPSDDLLGNLGDAPVTLDTITPGADLAYDNFPEDQPEDLPEVEGPDLSRDGAKLSGEDGEPVRIGHLGASDRPQAVGSPSDGSGAASEELDAQDNEATRTRDLIERLRNRMAAGDGPIVDRILGRIDADPETLRRLAKALTEKINAAADFEQASKEASEFNTYFRGASVMAAVGHGVTAVVLGPAGIGAGTAVWAAGVAGAVYGAASTMNFDRSPGWFALNALAGGAVGGGLGAGFGHIGDKLPKFIATRWPGLANMANGFEIPLSQSVTTGLTSAGIGAGAAWLMGDTREDIFLAAVSSGVGGAVSNYAAQELARAANLTRLHAQFDPTPGPPNNDPVLFGQQAVSPNFSSAGRLKGASIEEVAARLAVGGDDLGGVVQRGQIVKIRGLEPYTALDPVDLPVQYVWSNGQKFVVNNRSQTTLSLAGKKPVEPEDMTGRLPRWGPDSEVSVYTRLTEMGNKPSTLSHVRLHDKRGSPIAYSVPLQQ